MTLTTPPRKTAPAPRRARDTVHLCPPVGSGLTPCCRVSPLELPANGRITTDPSQVTCSGRKLF